MVAQNPLGLAGRHKTEASRVRTRCPLQLSRTPTRAAHSRDIRLTKENCTRHTKVLHVGVVLFLPWCIRALAVQAPKQRSGNPDEHGGQDESCNSTIESAWRFCNTLDLLTAVLISYNNHKGHPRPTLPRQEPPVLFHFQKPLQARALFAHRLCWQLAGTGRISRASRRSPPHRSWRPSNPRGRP